MNANSSAEERTETSANFRFWGDDLDPKEIEARLGIVADHAVRKGETFVHGRRTRRQAETGVWLLSSSTRVDSGRLEEHICALLKVLEPVSREVRDVADTAGICAEFSCLWISAKGYGGPWLSADVLRRVGALSADLVLDVA